MGDVLRLSDNTVTITDNVSLPRCSNTLASSSCELPRSFVGSDWMHFSRAGHVDGCGFIGKMDDSNLDELRERLSVAEVLRCVVHSCYVILVTVLTGGAGLGSLGHVLSITCFTVILLLRKMRVTASFRLISICRT